MAVFAPWWWLKYDFELVNVAADDTSERQFQHLDYNRLCLSDELLHHGFGHSPSGKTKCFFE